jgi:hypothetical protein
MVGTKGWRSRSSQRQADPQTRNEAISKVTALIDLFDRAFL